MSIDKSIEIYQKLKKHHENATFILGTSFDAVCLNYQTILQKKAAEMDGDVVKAYIAIMKEIKGDPMKQGKVGHVTMMFSAALFELFDNQKNEEAIDTCEK